MFIEFLLLILGFAMLLGGGDLIVRGASVLAKNLGISQLVIGLTVVAFGTSAPELSINILAAVKGNTEISFGNIIGSNIANIGLVIGCAALIKPLTIEGSIITREIPMMTLASILALIAGSDMFLKGSINVFDRSDGLVFLLLFSVFLYYTISSVFRKREEDPLIDQIEEFQEKKRADSSLFNLLLLISGMFLLFTGGEVSVNAAVKIAEHLHVPKVIIGLTIVALGTSLPELATSIIATFKGQTDLAIGNVVGSNIFNILLVNGICSTIKPISIPVSGGMTDLYMMTFLSLLLLPMCITDKGKVVRWEGIVLITLYFSYNTWRVVF